jgi:hypothetical protein
MRAHRVEFWIWVLVYAGMILFGLGMSLRGGGVAWAGAVIGVAVVLAALGVFLIWVRSRMRSPDAAAAALTARGGATKNPPEAPR